MSSTTQPNTTLYVNNLNDKVNKEELRLQLYALFTTHGKLIDIIASKKERMRGQAWLVFSDLAGATSALRACEGMLFYDKPLHIDYAKSKSYATLRKEDPNFVPPNSANASALVQSRSEKRQRDEDSADQGRTAKREKSDEDEDEEEMEIDDDEDQPSKTPGSAPPPVQKPSARLLCTNLPEEVTDDMLGHLFQQYKGYKGVQISWSPTPHSSGSRAKMAQVSYESADLSTIAKDALNGFSIKGGWLMSVAYI